MAEVTTAETFWGAEAELLPEKPAVQPVNPAATTEPVIKRIPREVAEAQARMAVSGLNFVQCLISRPLVNMKMNRVELKYLDEKERERAAELVYKEEPPANEAEKHNKQLYTKLIEKRVELLNGIPLSDQQEQDLTKIISDYEQATGKQISANLILGLGIVGILGQKGYDIATADIEIAA